MKIFLRKYADFKFQNEVESIENWNHEVLAYLFAYVIPFVSVSDSKKIYIISILMVVTFLIFNKSELLKYNVFLLLIGFDIVKVSFTDNSHIFLLKKSVSSIKKWDIINYGEISNNIYFLS
jgi:hypothetical protein